MSYIINKLQTNKFFSTKW